MKERFFKCVCLLFLILPAFNITGQDSLKSNLELEEIAQHLVNDSLVADRIAANELLKQSLLERLKHPDSRRDDFKELTAVSVQDSGDDVFRIFSWQLFINQDEYKHEAIIQFINDNRPPIVLLDQSDDIRNPDRKELTVDNWFGALYYNIIPFKLKGKMKYLLFGFDGATRAENCKIADILNIDKKGNISFGAPLFESEVQGSKKIAYRHFHQYDQNAKAILRYDMDQEIIIYDHLIPWTSKEIGVGMTFVPDGSYEGFKLKKGAWRHIEKVYNYQSEVPVTADNPFGKKDKEGQR